MAKGKHAAALFEVIHKGNSINQPVRKRTPRLGLPKWWSHRSSDNASDASRGDPAPQIASRDAGSPPASTWGVDRRLRLFSLHLSYRAATLTAIGALALITIAFSVGRRMGHSAPPLLSLSSDQLRSGPASPQVLDVARSQGQTAPGNDTQRTPARNDTAPAHVLTHAQRSVGLNYVVIQSYLKADAAEQARDLLIKNNIPCTIEKNLPRYGSPGWYSVVGLTGFDRIRGVREYQDYINAINRVSSNHSARNAGFKNFDPQPYKWQ